MSGDPTTTASADPNVLAAIERGNAVVFFDVALGEGTNAAALGRIRLELFVKDVRLITSTEWQCPLVQSFPSHQPPSCFFPCG